MNRDHSHMKALSGKPYSSFSQAQELRRICNIFLSGIKAEQALGQALGIIRNISGLENIFGLLYLSDRDLLEPIEHSAGKGFPPLELNRNLLGLLASDRKGLDLESIDLKSLGQSHPWWPFFELNKVPLERVHARLLLPLGMGQELYGMIVLGKGAEPVDLGREELILLQLAARQAALGLARLSLIKSVKDTSFKTRLKTLEVETLQDVGVAISSHLDLNQLTSELLLRAVSVLNINRAMVLLDNPEDSSSAAPGRMYVAESFGLDEAESEKLNTFDASKLVLDNLADMSHTMINDPDQAGRILGCRKLLVVPIQFKGELLGAIMVADKESLHQKETDFDEDDLRLLTAMANQAGAAISNARLYRNVLQIKNYNENILTSIASGVITTDRKGRIVSFNDSAARIFSVPAVQAVGMQVENLFKSIGLDSLAAQLGATLKEKDSYQETNLHAETAQGTSVVFNISATPLILDQESSSFAGLVISVENISEEAMVKETLKRYVSSNVVDLVLEKGHELVLGGSLCEVTILFADIRGFTRLSEEHGPQEVVDLLNNYFDLIIDVVFRYNGTVDKIVGDEIMVLFGAPFPFKDDTLRAVGCAIEMLETLERFNRERQVEGKFPLAVGVGLNRGSVISGNIGSAKHMDYTVIGDAVNLASRLVDHAGESQILITRSVYKELAGSEFLCRKIESLRVKGKKDPVEIYEVLGKRK